MASFRRWQPPQLGALICCHCPANLGDALQLIMIDSMACPTSSDTSLFYWPFKLRVPGLHASLCQRVACARLRSWQRLGAWGLRISTSPSISQWALQLLNRASPSRMGGIWRFSPLLSQVLDCIYGPCGSNNVTVGKLPLDLLFPHGGARGTSS